MAFPFPINPVDGQTVSHLIYDGSVLQATYVASKNAWEVKRSAYQPSLLLSTRAGVTLPVASSNGQVLTWSSVSNEWVASSIILATKDLTDVDHSTTPSNGNILVYSSAENKYKPVPLAGGIVLNSTTLGVSAKISGGASSVSVALTEMFRDSRPTSTLKGGDVYIIKSVKGNPALDKYAGTYYYDGHTWLIAVSYGGATVNYRDSDKIDQTPGRKVGDIDVLFAQHNKQLNVYDGFSYQPLFGESEIKQWIAAGSLYQGTVTSDSELSALPAASSNRGHYWVWAGSPGHVATTPVAATLNVGDWIQSNGTAYTHIPSDFLAKQRWESLGSFKGWSDGAWEATSLVFHNHGFYRASSPIIAGDPAPDAVGNTKWQQLDLSFSLEQLTNVNDNVSALGQDCVLVWDETNQEWTASRTLEVDAIEFDESGPGVSITGIAAQTMTVPLTSDPDSWVPSVTAVKDFVANINLENLGDTQNLKSAVSGDVPTYNQTLGVWEPKKVGVSSISNIGDVLITSTPQKGDVLKWDSTLTRWASAPAKLVELGDVSKHATPSLGEAPFWTYENGHPEHGQFVFKTPIAHIKNWDSVSHFESGAVVYNHGQLWRATRDSSNVEPKVEDGRTQLYIHVPGEPTFGILPTDITSTPPPSGLQPMQFKLGYWLQYTNDHTVAVWKWVLKGADPGTHKPIGEWEGRPWTCMVWRSPNPPAAPVPPMTVVVWVRSEPGSNVNPVKGQQDWASMELTTYLSQSADVSASTPSHGDILLYDTSVHKWKSMHLQDFANLLKPFLATSP